MKYSEDNFGRFVKSWAIKIVYKSDGQYQSRETHKASLLSQRACPEPSLTPSVVRRMSPVVISTNTRVLILNLIFGREVTCVTVNTKIRMKVWSSWDAFLLVTSISVPCGCQYRNVNTTPKLLWRRDVWRDQVSICIMNLASWVWYCYSWRSSIVIRTEQRWGSISMSIGVVVLSPSQLFKFLDYSLNSQDIALTQVVVFFWPFSLIWVWVYCYLFRIVDWTICWTMLSNCVTSQSFERCKITWLSGCPVVLWHIQIY